MKKILLTFLTLCSIYILPTVYANTIDISGIVYSDMDGSYSYTPGEEWLNPMVMNAPGTSNTGITMYVNIVQGMNVIVSKNISYGGGTYSASLAGSFSGNYDVILTNNGGSASVMLPTGWNLSTPRPTTSLLSPVIGKYTINVPSTSTNTNIPNLDFGLAETIPPKVSATITNIGVSTLSGMIYTILVSVNEPLDATTPLSSSMFSITNGSILSSMPVGSTGGLMSFDVQVNPNFYGNLAITLGSGSVRDIVDNYNNIPNIMNIPADTVSPPVPTISQSGATAGTSPFIVSGSSESGSTTRITTSTGLLVCSGTGSSASQYTCSISTVGYPDGVYTFYATSYDFPSQNPSIVTPFTIIVDRSAPSVVVTVPTIGAFLTGISLSPEASTSNNLARIYISASTYLSGYTAGSISVPGYVVVATGQYSGTGYYADIRIPAGFSGNISYTIPVGAVANGLGIRNTVSVTGSFSIDTAAPAIRPLVIEGYIAPGVPVLSGTGEPNSTISILSGPNLVCTATVLQNGTWRCPSVYTFGSGSQAVQVSATDRHGNVSTVSAPYATQNLSIVLTQPTLILSTPLPTLVGKVCPVLSQIYRPTDIVFVDVTNNWAKQYIYSLAMHKVWYNTFIPGSAMQDGMGIVNNVEKYRPDDSVTRAEFLKMISRSLKCEYEFMGNITPYTDVPEAMWYSEYVSFALSRTWISTTRSKFLPNEYLRREDAARIMSQALHLTIVITPGPTGFSDVSGASPSAPYIRALTTAGVINGQNGKYRPTDRLTRAEMAKIIAKSFGMPAVNI